MMRRAFLASAVAALSLAGVTAASAQSWDDYYWSVLYPYAQPAPVYVPAPVYGGVYVGYAGPTWRYRTRYYGRGYPRHCSAGVEDLGYGRWACY